MVLLRDGCISLDVGDIQPWVANGLHEDGPRVGVNGRLGRFQNSFVLQRGNFNNRTTHLLRKFLNVDSVTGFSDNIHHVNGNDNRDSEFD